MSSLTAPTPAVLYTLSLHDALPISGSRAASPHRQSAVRVASVRPPAVRGFLPDRPWLRQPSKPQAWSGDRVRSEEHTSELQSRLHLVCRRLLEKKKVRRL